MSVNQGLAHVSTDFMIAALLIYSLALLAFAGDYAFGRPRRRAAMLAAKPAVDRAAQLATVGAAPSNASCLNWCSCSMEPGKILISSPSSQATAPTPRPACACSRKKA